MLAFTIITLFIISISVYLLRAQYQTKTNKSVTDTTIQNKNIYVDIDQIRTALEMYLDEHDTYPARLEELKKYLSSIPTQSDGSSFTYTRISPGKYKLSGKKSDGSIYTVGNP